VNPGMGMPVHSRVQSMAGMSMWGAGSAYDGGGGGMNYAQPPLGMSPAMGMGMGMGMGMPQAPGMYGNPFDSPASEHASLRPPTFFPVDNGMMVTGAPRNSIMSGLGGGMGQQGRMSTYSLVTTANPLVGGGGGVGGGAGGGMGLVPNGDPRPSDEEILSVLRRYLAQQDLMSV
jgi:chitin synthase